MAALSIIHGVIDVTGRRLVSSIYSCDIYGSSKSVDPIYIESPLTLKILVMQQAILKSKEGLAHLSLDLISDLQYRDYLVNFFVRMSF
jgi:hypothetical protein